MAVVSTNGLRFLMSNGTTIPAKVTATAITAAKPAVVTVADTTGMKDGQAVTVNAPLMPSIDKQTFIVGSLSATEFTLVGSDATADNAGTAGEFTYYDDTIDMVPLCLTSIGFTQDASSPISVASFCNPSASIPGLPPQAPTLSVTFYLDVSDAGYCALLKAEEDTLERLFHIVFPGGNGDLVARGQVSSVIISDLPLEGSAALTAEITLSTKAMHRFNCP